MKTPVKLIYAAVVALVSLFATAQASSAMPIAPAANQQQGGSGLVQDAVWPCARGWVQNRWGRCVRVRPRYYYGPSYYYGPRYYHPRYYGGYRYGYRYGYGYRGYRYHGYRYHGYRNHGYRNHGYRHNYRRHR